MKRPIEVRKAKRTKSSAKSANDKPLVKRTESSTTHIEIGIKPTKSSDTPTKLPLRPMGSHTNANTESAVKATETATQVAFSPRPAKSSVFIIKPSAIQKESSFSAKTSEILDSVKEKTTPALETIKDGAGQGTIKTELPLGTEPLVIQVLEEKFYTSKKDHTEEVIIEKRWITKKEKVEVPVRYEEIFVNDKEITDYSTGALLNEIKDKILDVVYENKKPGTKIEGEIVPLLDLNETSGEEEETEKVIPLYAEQILVSKKIVPIGEVVVSKRKVIENRDIRIDTFKEEVTIEEPTGTNK